MIIQNNKTLEKLRNLINEETEYRSGPKLVSFFNQLGFNDSYGQGFPSRWVYTDEKLQNINGSPELDKCIKNIFNPANFIGEIDKLDGLIEDFNQYLAFDKWKVIRNETEITFQKIDKINLTNEKKLEVDTFLESEFSNVSLDKLNLDFYITDILKIRFDEIKKCFTSKAYLSVIFMSGSSLEGILLGKALSLPKQFSQSNAAPKDKQGKVKPFHEWTLSNLIDVAYDVRLLQEDVKKFSHVLRDFRNYIHPYQELNSNFIPDENTAKICFQVLKAAIYQISSINKPS